MSRRRFMTLATAACLLAGAVATAQERAAQENGPNEDVAKTRAGVDQQFDRRSPAVGAALPDLKAFDAEGKEVRLGSLQGQYTVLVFGCLT